MREASVEELSKWFWSGIEFQDDYPRQIEKAVAIKLPLAIVKLPLLNVFSIHSWLKNKEISACLPAYQRELMGCLVANKGYGIIFVSGADNNNEQRVTIAHETAHFLVDYLLPRTHLIKTLGESITDVLDGLRRPTSAERANAVLAHVRLGVHVHLIPSRDEDSDVEVACAEDRADALAVELVAPKKLVKRREDDFLALGLSRSAVLKKLAAHFGVPSNVLNACQEAYKTPTFLRESISLIRSKQQ